MLYHESEYGKLYMGDCLDLMQDIPDKSVDMILCDLPYGTTACKWDNIIPFEPLWQQYERVIKNNGAIVLFGSEPFSSHLRLSRIKLYKYDWYLHKNKASGFLNAKKMPLKAIENICVFCKSQPLYNPQGLTKVNKAVKNTGTKSRKNAKKNGDITSAHNLINQEFYRQEFANYPTSIIKCSNGSPKSVHPTQKSKDVCEYLIKTYTNENEVVLDNCIGSGTTAIACINTNRKYIGIEKDNKYCEIAKQRIIENLEGVGKS